MYFGCIHNLSSGNHFFFQNSLVINFQKQSFTWIIFFVLIGSYTNEAQSLTDDLIQLNSTGLPGIDVLKDCEATAAIQERWQERLSLAERRQGNKKEKDWNTHVLENAMFPALAALAVAGWYFSGQIPALKWLHPQFRAHHLVNVSDVTAIATVYPWVLRDAKRWLYGEEGERTEWLLAYTIFWGIQAGILMMFPGTYGHSLVWSQLAGYTFLDLLYQSGDIADDDDTLLFIMSVVSAVMANVFYFVVYPANPVGSTTHVVHALSLVNGGMVYYLLNRIGREEKPLDEPCR